MPRLGTFVRRVRPDEELSIVEHLDELRNRIIIALGAFLAAYIVVYAFHERIMRALVEPLPGEQQQLVTLSPAEGLFTVLKVSFWVAVLVVLPIWLYQLYAFVMPAIADQPRRRTVAIIASVSALFLGGVAFGFFIVLPVALDWLLGFGGDLFTNSLRAGDYFSFVTGMLLGTGLMFEVPVAMLAFARLGVTTAAMYITHWRIALVVIAAVAALLPGGDPVSMLLLMLPQIVLYAFGIWLAKMFGQPAAWRRDLWSDDTGDPTAG